MGPVPPAPTSSNGKDAMDIFNLQAIQKENLLNKSNNDNIDDTILTTKQVDLERMADFSTSAEKPTVIRDAAELAALLRPAHIFLEQQKKECICIPERSVPEEEAHVIQFAQMSEL